MPENLLLAEAVSLVIPVANKEIYAATKEPLSGIGPIARLRPASRRVRKPFNSGLDWHISRTKGKTIKHASTSEDVQQEV